MILGGGAFGRLGYEGLNTHGWDWCPSERGPRECRSSFCHVKTQQEGSSYETGSGPSPDTESAGALIWDLASTTERNNSDILLKHLKWTRHLYVNYFHLAGEVS